MITKISVNSTVLLSQTLADLIVLITPADCGTVLELNYRGN